MEIFEKFESLDLGLHDKKVELLEHNPNWIKAFNEEKTRIIKTLNIDSLKLHHGGSTAIANIVPSIKIKSVGLLNIKEINSFITQSLHYLYLINKAITLIIRNNYIEFNLPYLKVTKKCYGVYYLYYV